MSKLFNTLQEQYQALIVRKEQDEPGEGFLEDVSSFIADVHSSSLTTSHRIPTASTPLAPNLSAAACTPFSSMSKSPILVPSLANLRQIAAPIPLAAPVTTITLFLKLSKPIENTLKIRDESLTRTSRN